MRLIILGGFVLISIGPSFAACAAAASRDDIGFVLAESLPSDIWDAVGSDQDYQADARINPFYLNGDFDGDGMLDTAVLVKHRATGKTGAAIVWQGGKVQIIGAGQDIGDGTTDLDWMDAWYVEPKREFPGKGKPKGDSLMVIKTESGSGLIWWDGKRFRWLQRGD